MDTKGYIKFSRSTIQSDVFMNKPDKWFKMWFYILTQVNHKGYKNIKRGENLFKYSEIMYFTGATKGVCDSFIRWCKSHDMITTRKTTRGFIISVVNYCKYQDKDYCIHDTENASHTTEKRHAHDTHTTLYTRTKERKNDKDISKDISCEQGSQENVRDPVNQLIDVFYNTVNPTITYGNKTNRAGAQWLIKKFGLEQALGMAQRVCGEQMPENITPFTPTCTTPYQLQTRLAQWVIYFRKKESGQIINEITRV